MEHQDERPRETYVAVGSKRNPVGSARLFCRELGAGPPEVMLHGGPKSDHAYLVPEMDGLAASSVTPGAGSWPWSTRCAAPGASRGWC